MTKLEFATAYRIAYSKHPHASRIAPLPYRAEDCRDVEHVTIRKSEILGVAFYKTNGSTAVRFTGWASLS